MISHCVFFPPQARFLLFRFSRVLAGPPPKPIPCDFSQVTKTLHEFPEEKGYTADGEVKVKYANLKGKVVYFTNVASE